MRKLCVLAVAVALSGAATGWSQATIQVDASKQGAKISPEHYGVFLEEINHGVDGGLYAEMLQNRAFEDAKAPEGFTYQVVQNSGRGRRAGGGGGSGFRGTDAHGGHWVNPGGYATTFVWDADKSLPYWSLVQDGGAQGAMSLDMTNPMSEASPRSCKLEITDLGNAGRVGIANEGWCARPGQSAVGIKEGEKYELSFYARCAPGFVGTINASLESTSEDAGKESDVAKISGIGPEWKQFKAELTATKTDPGARFILAAVAKGTLWFDMVSLFPAKTFKNRANGMRTDIAQMIADMKPGFVRFPGGCVVEAATVETTYNWKNTIGPLVDRPECWNAWDYRRTHGVGMYEYLQFIEDVGATPLYVGFAGQTCIYRAPAVVPMDQMDPYVQNFIDLADYANGSAESKWGKLRAVSGHPAPFGLHLMEIGNENTDPGGGRGQPATQVYTPRYAMTYDALKKAHPEVETVADFAVRNHPVEMVDDHHYADPNFFFSGWRSFDSRSRQLPPLYLGEVAVTSGQNVNPERGNLWAALAEGVYLMGAEKNADVVKMVSYAPLLGHVNGRTELAGAPPPWHAMIYFDSTRVYGTVSYYLWKTFGINRPSVNLETNVTMGQPTNGITGNVGIGTWGDTQAEFKDFKVEKDGKTLYASDFAKGTNEWTVQGGQWGVVDGAARQSGNQNAVAYVGDPSWSDYTITLKARKLSGAEGFLIVFGHKGSDQYWWNVGGWGNTRHEIEMNQTPLGKVVDAVVEENKWYDIKVELKGSQVTTYLDGQVVQQVNVPAPTGVLQAISGRDDATGDLVMKVINRGAEPQKTTIDVAGVRGLASQAKVTTLTSGGLRDNNSLDNPAKIVPEDKEIQIAGPRFEYEFPAYSLTVLRMKMQ